MSDTTIPADAIAGLLGDWLGPVLGPDGRTHVRIGAWTPRFPGDSVIVVADGPGAMSDDGAEVGAAPASALRLDCLRPEVQARVGSVLAAGVECPRCIEGQVMDSTAMYTGSPPVDTCHACNGTGYLRKLSPIYHLTDASRTNVLSNQHIAEAVAWSVRSVARGGEVLAGWVPEWSIHDGEGYDIGIRGTIDDRFCVVSGTDRWALYIDGKAVAGGPETGPEGRAKADDALREYNIGFIDGGALVLPGELE